MWGLRVNRFELSRVRRLLTLPGVETLFLMHLEWTGIPEDSRSFILNGLPGLTVLRLNFISFEIPSHFVDLVRACPALRVLEIDKTRVSKGYHPQAIVPLQVQMHVQKLHICFYDNGHFGDGHERLLDWFAASPKVWPVESLKVGPLDHHHVLVDKAWRFVQTLKPTLKDFFVFLGPNERA